ncbi:hypothetical protein HDU78_005636 [Chytriomyces hyalinus]|nr:hypothetical protein HDU78_005636 [Chytriomyces hyalinus]
MTTAAKQSEVIHTQPASKLQRKLKARHLEMIAIGGAIGTGLFLKSGSAVYSAGPLGALICFVLAGIQVFFVSSAIGEMSAFLPIEGAFSQLPDRFVNRAFGFASGWNYWLSWVLGVPAELSAIGGFMSFWITTVPTWVWSAVYLVPIALVNLASVSAFGETEFVLSSTKVLAIIVFLIISFFVWFGVGTGTKPLWFTNWDPAINGATPGDQVTNIANAMLSSFFSFGGCELIGLTAGEAVNPRTTVPRAINGTFYRILIFYVGSIFALGVLVRSDSPVLDPNNPDGLLQSPFVYVYSLVGIRAASHIMNAVIIIAVLSALNSSIYACSRTLSQLATDGYAPKLFASVTSNGVPMPAVLVSIAFGSVAIIGGYVAQREGPVFNFLSNFIALSIMINWVSMSYVHLRFRYGYLAQGRSLKDLPYVAPFFPWADLISIVFGILVAFLLVFFAFYQVTEFGMDWYIYNSWLYCGIPVFVLSFVGKGVYDGVKSGKGLWSGFSLVKFEDMDFETGKWVEDFELNEASS